MNEGELDELVWSFAPSARRRRPSSLQDIPAVTTESTALSKTLRSRGFRFVGPTTIVCTRSCSPLGSSTTTLWDATGPTDSGAERRSERGYCTRSSSPVPCFSSRMPADRAQSMSESTPS